ncbi:S8 family peptidase [Myceligenerans indicum]|uniref:S8 family peptidase n=1 Tax=Myceligenerans indicum TaxID=2593663 RepID=A0ABS1LJL1_9MICO|nr:S8 family peptidase [Myceligenerans indicum]MBL0885752.1 S8 family peptidase [Myceligenerans indicum]
MTQLARKTAVRRLTAVAAGLALTAVSAATAQAAVPAPEGRIVGANAPGSVENSYIVVLENGAVARTDVPGKAKGLVKKFGGTVENTYSDAVKGFETTMSESAARRLAADPSVAYVEQNAVVHATGTQSPTPSWGLDRIDQQSLPLDDSYTYPNSGTGVTAYIVDTGIRMTHQDFGGRAVSGIDTVDGDNDATDCNGHGTHVAGTVGGSSYGVAKNVDLVAVRVLDCSGSGTYAGVIDGINWVASDHAAGDPAVANMSLGGGLSQAVNDAVAAAVADGVTFAVAAGNERRNACRTSPASEPTAITVGATTSSDDRASYSNYGECLDIFAPGSSITSAWSTSDTATNTISGTSMATPHVTGAAALVLAAHPGYTPAQVDDALVNGGVAGVVGNARRGSPNVLLNVSFL